MPRLHPALFAGLVLFPLAGGCGDPEGGVPTATAPPPAVCTEANPEAARIVLTDREVTALAAVDGQLVIGARSLRIDEPGTLARVAFDGRPPRDLSAGYVGGTIVVAEGIVLHPEPKDATHAGRLLVTPIDGSAPSRVVEGPPLVLGEFDVLRGRAYWFGQEGSDIALWSYDPRAADAKAVRIAEATGGGLFSSGHDLLQARVPGEPGDAQRTVHVGRFDPSSGSFVTITSFPVFERTIVGADAGALYLFDAPTRNIRRLAIASGEETATLGRDLDPNGGAHLTSDAIYTFQTSTRRLERIDLETGAQEVVLEAPETSAVTAFASDACYVYAVIEGMRTIARVPRGSAQTR